jgi:hypothetical protein
VTGHVDFRYNWGLDVDFPLVHQKDVDYRLMGLLPVPALSAGKQAGKNVKKSPSERQI